MTTTVRRRAASLLAAAAVTAGPLATAAPALAHAPQHRGHHAACSISAAERAEATDALAAVKGRLAGHKPTEAEKKALHDAIAELRTAASQVRMTAEVRAAKKAELSTLDDALEAATTAEERTAIRAERSAVRGELAAARPTHAERRALEQAIRDLKVALRAKPTQAEKRQLKAQVKAIQAKLACTTPRTSTPTDPAPGTGSA